MDRDLTEHALGPGAELANIVATEGWAALWQGAGLRVAKLAPRMAISLALYDGLQHCEWVSAMLEALVSTHRSGASTV